MLKINCVWRFDKILLKENYFFSICVIVGENSIINISRFGNGIFRLFGGFFFIYMKGVG